MPLGQLGREGAVVEDRLDRALAVVEVAAEAEHQELELLGRGRRGAGGRCGLAAIAKSLQ